MKILSEDKKYGLTIYQITDSTVKFAALYFNMKKKVLFVCWGNICRSPSAEAVFTAIIEKAGLENKFEIDSAGTIAAHSGEPADARMQSHAIKRGYRLTSRSRKINASIDFDYFDYIIAMDNKNVGDLLYLSRNEDNRNKITKMTDYCSQFAEHSSVPDPYYGGSAGFELVLDLLEDACEGFLYQIQNDEIRCETY